MNARRFKRFLLIFLTLSIFWILLSGKFDAFHITVGLISACVVALFSRKLLVFDSQTRGGLAKVWGQITQYIFWLIYQIFISGLAVTKLVFKRTLPINPGIIKCAVRLKGDIPLTILANSITLTPGTMTMDIKNDEIFIHCLVIEDEKALMASESEFEEKIQGMFRSKDRGETL